MSFLKYSFQLSGKHRDFAEVAIFDVIFTYFKYFANVCTEVLV